MSALAPTLQAFFTDRLIRQRHASPNTIAAYRDAFKLLLRFVSEHAGVQPSQLDVADLDAATIAAFLDHLETDRGNSVPSRNARLAAIRSLFRFAALRHPNTPRSSNECWPSHPNASTVPSSTTCPIQRSTRCSPRPTRPHGPDDATTLCWRSQSRPACDCQN